VVSDKIALASIPMPRRFTWFAEGDTDHIRREFGKSEVTSLNGVEARSLFSLDYLKDMGKVMSRAAEVEVSLGVDHPAKFSFAIAGGKGHVEYLLAPGLRRSDPGFLDLHDLAKYPFLKESQAFVAEYADSLEDFLRTHSGRIALNHAVSRVNAALNLKTDEHPEIPDDHPTDRFGVKLR